jgi:hypothetical protein
MTSNQELYAKSLEIAAILLDKPRMKVQPEKDRYLYGLFLDDYKALAQTIAETIIEEAKKLPV